MNNLIAGSEDNKKRQVTYIAPLNHLPLLPSGPGGFSRSWSYKTCPAAKIEKVNQ